MIGVSNPQLAAAVASSGALGSLGLGGGSAAAVEDAITRSVALTNSPINLNFFCHARPTVDSIREAAWLRQLEPLFAELGATPPPAISAPYGTFDDQPETLQALLDNRVRVVSFHFGLPATKTVATLKAEGIVVLSSATSVAEAQWLEANGADAVIAQGWEAGGHRGRFTDSGNDEQLGLLALLPQMAQTVKVPVIAAGAINNGASAAAALTLGAAAVQLGTAFVSCPESSAGSAYRAALLQEDRQTLMTPVFSGRPARGLENRTSAALQSVAAQAPDYPIAYDAGKALAAVAAKTEDPATTQNYSAMWAGQGFRYNRVMRAARLVELLVRELHIELARNTPGITLA